MTGTGTQEDPYVVDTWSDFVTAIGEEKAYVSLNVDIDMNEIAPQGVGNITVSAELVDGKGHTISNIREDGNSMFNIVPGCTMQNINFKNFIATSNFFTYSNNSGRRYFYNCVFTGVVEGGNFITQGGTSFQFDSNANAGCGFNISFNNGTLWNSNENYPIQFNDSNLNFKNFNSNKLTYLENCYISGNITKNLTILHSKNSVFDCDVPENITITLSTANSNILINSDKCKGTVSGSGYTLVTTEQLKNAEYLESIGFPIGVE